MVSPRAAVVVHNPAARKAPPRARLEEAARSLSSLGWSVEVQTPNGITDTERIVRSATAGGVEAVLACGGDGTLNSVLRSVLTVIDELPAGSEGPAVGLIPAGTGNVWAQEAGIPRDVARAMRMLDEGERHRADLGVARIGESEPHPFLLMCSGGIDARVVNEVEHRGRWKRLLGRAAFVWPALTELAAARLTEVRVEVDGTSEVMQLHEVVAGNTRLFGGLARLASDALLDDGELDLVTFEGRAGPGRRVHALRLASRALGGGLARANVKGIGYRRGRRIVIEPTTELPVQADGEFIGVARPDAPLTLTVEPRVVTLITGQRAGELFRVGEDGAWTR